MTTSKKSGGTSLHKAAVKLGHQGGIKGGTARANKLTASRRSEIAKLGGQAKNKK
jgi:hypothetical protein